MQTELIFLWIAYAVVIVGLLHYGLPILKKNTSDYSENLRDTFDKLSVELDYLEHISNEVEQQYKTLLDRMQIWDEELKKQIKIKRVELQAKHDNMMNKIRKELNEKLKHRLDSIKKNEIKNYTFSVIKDELRQYFLQHKQNNSSSIMRAINAALTFKQ